MWGSRSGMWGRRSCAGLSGAHGVRASRGASRLRPRSSALHRAFPRNPPTRSLPELHRHAPLLPRPRTQNHNPRPHGGSQAVAVDLDESSRHVGRFQERYNPLARPRGVGAWTAPRVQPMSGKESRACPLTLESPKTAILRPANRIAGQGDPEGPGKAAHGCRGHPDLPSRCPHVVARSGSINARHGAPVCGLTPPRRTCCPWWRWPGREAASPPWHPDVVAPPGRSCARGLLGNGSLRRRRRPLSAAGHCVPGGPEGSGGRRGGGVGPVARLEESSIGALRTEDGKGRPAGRVVVTETAAAAPVAGAGPGRDPGGGPNDRNRRAPWHGKARAGLFRSLPG